MKHFQHIFQFSVIVILLVLSASNLHAQHAPVKKIKGMVFDSTANKQIPHPTITCTTSDGKITKTVTGHVDGFFKIRLNHNYFWDMTISAPGYETMTIKSVNANKNYKRVWVVFKLKKIG